MTSKGVHHVELSKNWSNPPLRLPVEARYTGCARLRTVLPLTAIEAISGLAGSSENSALQGRPALSFQLTRAESAVELTVIEPGPGPVISKGTTAARAVNADAKRATIDFIGRLWRGSSVTAGPFPSTPFQTVLAVFPHTA